MLLPWQLPLKMICLQHIATLLCQYPSTVQGQFDIIISEQQKVQTGKVQNQQEATFCNSSLVNTSRQRSK